MELIKEPDQVNRILLWPCACNINTSVATSCREIWTWDKCRTIFNLLVWLMIHIILEIDLPGKSSYGRNQAQPRMPELGWHRLKCLLAYPPEQLTPIQFDMMSATSHIKAKFNKLAWIISYIWNKNNLKR